MAYDREIKDFGEYIGGAKKELWKGRNLSLDDVKTFDDIDVKNYVNKNKLWKTPKWEEMVAEGYDKSALYFIKCMRDAFPSKPALMTKEEGERYTAMLEKYRERLYQVKTPDDIVNFNMDTLCDIGVVEKPESFYSRYIGTNYYTKKMHSLIHEYPDHFKKEAMKNDFLFTYEEKARASVEKIDLNASNVVIGTNEYNSYSGGKLQIAIKPSPYETHYYYSPAEAPMNTPEYYTKNPYAISTGGHQINCAFPTAKERDVFYESAIKLLVAKHEKDEAEKAKAEAEAGKTDIKSGTSRKTKLMPPQLEHIERTPAMPTLMNVQGQDFIDDFGIKGGEFGNWLNDNDRQANMNFAWMAFNDTALALGIPNSDIALGGKLNIAFGARGQGSALAHYEPDREVINLTKMRGAGSLGHEYFHALDNIIGKEYGADFLTTAQHNLPQYRSDNLMKAVKELVSVIRKRQMTPEEVANALLQDREKYTNQFNYVIDRFLPENGLNDTQKAELADIKKQLFEIVKTFDIDEYNKWEDASIKQDGSRSGTRYDIVNDFAEKNNYSPEWLVLCSKVYNFSGVCEDVAFVSNEEAYTQMLKEMSINTDFSNNAAKLDDVFSKSGHKNYWNSIEELAARAFACYLKDKLVEQDIRDDYLVGHAEMPGVSIDGKMVYTYPVGAEREAINKCFDNVIEALKEKSILHEREDEEVVVSVEEEQNKEPAPTPASAPAPEPKPEPECTVSLTDIFDGTALSRLIIIDSSTNNCVGMIDKDDCMKESAFGAVLSWFSDNLSVSDLENQEAKCDIYALIEKHPEVFEEFCTTHFNAELNEENALFIVEGLISRGNSEQDYEHFCTLLEVEQEKEAPVPMVSVGDER